MVFVKTPENLQADFDIGGTIRYDIAQERIGIRFNLKVKYDGDSEDKSFGIAVSRSEIPEVKGIFEQNKKEVAQKLEEIRGKIKLLLDFGEAVEVSLNDIGEQLVEVAKKGLEGKIRKRELEEISRRTKRTNLF